MKKWILLFAVFLLILPGSTYAGSFGGDYTGTPGQWYVGDAPASQNTSKSPVVFVHGLNSSSNTWWNGNDMYSTALANGYQTAFVDLYPTKNMWDNGALLSQKLSEIYQYFGGKKLVLVTHSKGGIDAQSALVHYGAHQYVSNLITLSTPHSGSQLADLAYSSWAGWLSGILGSKNDAVYSLQTGYMSQFRTQTDAHANARKNPIYTFGGTKWGSFGSSLYWGGVYLSSYGSNDGAVTVQSSRLGYGREIKIGSWDHYSVNKGSSTFLLFEPYLRTAGTASFTTSNGEDVSASDASSAFYIRGGEFSGVKQESFYAEDGVKKVTVDWLSSSKQTKLSLHSPDGKKVITSFKTAAADGIFSGAYHHQAVLTLPESGKWQLTAQNQDKEAYLLHVSYSSDNHDAISMLPLSKQNQRISFKTNSAKALKETEATITIDHYKNKTKIRSQKLTKTKQQTSAGIHLVQEGLYNITVEARGKTQKGEIIERTFIKSVYVDADGKWFVQ
ncbi:esterase/lipase family protein [Metabacillus sp. JX24]|uniref:esterase/lipase family protein n=1 Tax=Metabacillus sp. JX24 TaxID=3240759 RepID=UPI0035106CC7